MATKSDSVSMRLQAWAESTSQMPQVKGQTAVGVGLVRGYG